MSAPGAVAAESGHPFDAVAGAYDRTFTDTRLGRWLRARVQERLGRAFAAGDRVLELGCGTGEDALFLARRGVEVTALDASGEMIAVARRKAAAAPDEVGARLRFLRHRLAGDPGTEAALPAPVGNDPGDEDGDGRYDGAFSSFGALNCLADPRPLAAALAARLRPGAPLVLVLMGPFCLLETAAFLLRGRPRAAFRRWRSGAPARVGDATLPVWYPTPGDLRRRLAPAFRHRRTVGVGVVLPPTHLAPLVERHPRLFAPLARLDSLAGARWPGPWLADHYLAVFERAR